MKHNYKWVLNLAALIAAILTITVTTVGVLATPVILSLMYEEWYWMFLYLAYLAIILLISLICIRFNLLNEGGRKK